MNNLHALLVKMFDDDKQLAKDLKNASKFTFAQRQILAYNHARRLYPARPEGKVYLPKSFWDVLAKNNPLRIAFCGPHTKADRVARFIQEGMKWNGGKPKALFTKPSHQPEPWDGKQEKPGNIPWDGRR